MPVHFLEARRYQVDRARADTTGVEQKQRQDVAGFFEWDAAKLSLQIQEMDDEHKVLISLMNRLHALDERKASGTELVHALDELVAYTAKHFADEEKYMERVAYPGLRIHRGVHKQLLEKLAGFQTELRSTHKVSVDLFVFLKMWLSAHICGIDMKYAHHVRERKAG